MRIAAMQLSSAAVPSHRTSRGLCDAGRFPFGMHEISIRRQIVCADNERDCANTADPVIGAGTASKNSGANQTEQIAASLGTCEPNRGGKQRETFIAGNFLLGRRHLCALRRSLGIFRLRIARPNRNHFHLSARLLLRAIDVQVINDKANERM